MHDCTWHRSIPSSRALRALVGAWAVLLAGASHAWDAPGHETVGAIADALIAGTPAETQIHALLGGLSLQQAAVWADCAKGVESSDDVTFTYVENDAAYPECAVFNTAADKAAFESFVSRNWKQCGTAHGTEMCHNQYHYADISTRRKLYATTEVGATDHDVVHSIDGAIAVLRGLPAPPPFNIANQKEALLILSHYVGDIHQPLHVEAVYLNGTGKVVDPDAIGYSASNDTAGGNLVFDGTERFHHEWDLIPNNLMVNGATFDQLVTNARKVRKTGGDVSGWSVAWASDSVKVGHAAFASLHFAPRNTGSDPTWTVSGDQAPAYVNRADALKAKQLTKAGARLAQVLQAIWP